MFAHACSYSEFLWYTAVFAHNLDGCMCIEDISVNPGRLKSNDQTVLSAENTRSFHMFRRRKTGKDISVQECSGYDFLLSLLLIPNLRGKLSI